MNLYTTGSSGEKTNSIPIGLAVDPGIAGGNIIVASSANKKFKTEMFEYNINGITIKKGETKYGLIGIKADSFDSLKLKIEYKQQYIRSFVNREHQLINKKRVFENSNTLFNSIIYKVLFT